MPQPTAKHLANPYNAKGFSLAQCVFAPSASWQAVAASPLVGNQLKLHLHAPGDMELEWIVNGGNRPNSNMPTRIQLKVPPEEIARQSGWDFKAEIVTNLLSSEAHLAKEPLRTPFLQSLVAQGYKIVGITNAKLTDAAMEIQLAPRVIFSDVRLNASLTLCCDELNFENVEIFHCKLNFQVAGGTWKGVAVTGDTTHLIGQLGTTTIDKTCTFNGCYFNANITKGRFLGEDLRARFQATFGSNMIPEEIRKITTQMTEEEARLMFERLATGHWSDVEGGSWDGSSDRLR